MFGMFPEEVLMIACLRPSEEHAEEQQPCAFKEGAPAIGLCHELVGQRECTGHDEHQA